MQNELYRLQQFFSLFGVIDVHVGYLWPQTDYKKLFKSRLGYICHEKYPWKVYLWINMVWFWLLYYSFLSLNAAFKIFKNIPLCWHSTVSEQWYIFKKCIECFWRKTYLCIIQYYLIKVKRVTQIKNSLSWIMGLKEGMSIVILLYVT